MMMSECVAALHRSGIVLVSSSPNVITFVTAVAVVVVVPLMRYGIFGKSSKCPSVRLPEAVDRFARWRMTLAAMVFCVGLPILLPALVTPDGIRGALTALINPGQGLISFSPQDLFQPLLLLCFLGIPGLLIVVPARMRANCQAWREDSGVSGWLAGLGAVVAAGYLFVLHFLDDLLPKSGLVTLSVAAFGIAVLVAPFFKAIANSCWRGGVTTVLDPVSWGSQWLTAFGEMRAKPDDNAPSTAVSNR
jgi:hypothetical protein